jgi:acetylornithine/succinyldiaminopimelate/putrescine aminotransferase
MGEPWLLSQQQHKKKIHIGFKPLLSGFKYVPFNDINALKKALTKKTCAVLIEPIQGEGGVNTAHKTYLKTLRKICNEKGVLLILDEIQTGFGRTGPLFAYERYKIKPDIITLAKALGGGIAIGAMGSTNKIIRSFSPGTHGATFGGNPLACAASLASLKTLTKKGFLQKASSQGDYFIKQLHSLKEQFPTIQEVRGVGLMLAVELDQPGTKVVMDCMKEGILVNCIQQNTIRFLPPLIVTRKEIDFLIKILSKIFTKMQQ